MEIVPLAAGATLLEAGDDVAHAHFPLGGAVVSVVLAMRDGRTVEAATVGREGALGGVVSRGQAPAYGRAVVQLPGHAVRIPVARVEALKRDAPELQDILVRYADCLTAQALQSVGCATLHSLEARCARWLLLMHDRVRDPELHLTQEALAEMLGVARTYLTRIALRLQQRGPISYRRGVVRVEDRALLEEVSCECYGTVRRHFERVLPGLYPALED